MKVKKERKVTELTKYQKPYSYYVEEEKDVPRYYFREEVHKKFGIGRNKANQVIAYADKNGVSFDKAYKDCLDKKII